MHRTPFEEALSQDPQSRSRMYKVVSCILNTSGRRMYTAICMSVAHELAGVNSSDPSTCLESHMVRKPLKFIQICIKPRIWTWSDHVEGLVQNIGFLIDSSTESHSPPCGNEITAELYVSETPLQKL
mmetsp:Transcript_5713/g.21614  ORF Transcript_5713/g.21614 Transcript_5713/m.21614 type:complete len:127 (-) Transcript_5713:550-930(-)